MFKIILWILFDAFLGKILNDAIYNLKYENLSFIYKKKELKFFHALIGDINAYFRISNVIIEELKDSFYTIEHLKTNLNLNYLDNNELILDKRNNNFSLWKFFKNENNFYIIQNKNLCFFKIRSYKLYCENIPIEQASKFNLIKIYEEVKLNNNDINIIEKEPIDVLIKYIDLRDPFLNRKGIHQIKKDYENDELRYCVRSIIKYIPWVRKIFILMPNEKVRYFKEYDLIKNKIIYVKDKDILGYDSSNSLAFQFRYYKMKNFGIADNFITMDDDYFIGSPLKKTDFFYVENNKVIPAIVTNKFMEINETTAIMKLNYYRNIISQIKNDQSSEMFEFSLYLTYFFFIKKFNKSIIVPKYTHNAMPVNLKELKEIYELIYNSKYKLTTLDSLYRNLYSFQYQAFYFSYTFLQYNKKINNIPYKYMNNRYSIIENYNYSLLCINTGAINYSNLSFLKTKIVMEYLFPEPSPYELIDYSFSKISFDVMYTMQKKINYYIKNIRNKNKNNLKINNIFIEFLKYFLILLLFISIFFFMGKNIYFYYKKNKKIHLKLKEDESIRIKDIII